VYVVDGIGTAWEGDVATAVAAGDVVLIAAGTPHATVASAGSELVLVCFFPHPDLAANLEELAGPERA
jgi:quercetin dioxygenase-like cupin family protein